MRLPALHSVLIGFISAGSMHAILKYRNRVQICGTQPYDWNLNGRMKRVYYVRPALNPSHGHGTKPVRVADADLATRHAMGTIYHAQDRCDVNVDGLTMFCIAIPRLLRRLSATCACQTWSLEAHTRLTPGSHALPGCVTGQEGTVWMQAAFRHKILAMC
jgi:hypothetical protein